MLATPGVTVLVPAIILTIAVSLNPVLSKVEAKPWVKTVIGSEPMLVFKYKATPICIILIPIKNNTILLM